MRLLQITLTCKVFRDLVLLVPVQKPNRNKVGTKGVKIIAELTANQLQQI